MMTVKDAIEKFLNEQTGFLAQTTITWYAQRLGPLSKFNDMELDQMTGDALIQTWQDRSKRVTLYASAKQKPEREGKLSIYTLFGDVVTWRRFFNWCVKKGYLTTSPAAQLRKPKLPDVPPKAIAKSDMQKIVKQARRSKYPKRDRAIVMFLADTGCRVSGLVGLKLEDLDMKTGRATVREKGNGGQRKARTVYMSQATIKAMQDYLKERGSIQPGDTIFRSDDGRSLTAGGVYQVLERLACKVNVRSNFNPHAFRHGFARGALENGMDLGTLQRLMGHEDITTTLRFYARWDDKDVKEKHERYSWLVH